MTYRSPVILGLLVCTSSTALAVDPSELKPGLVATFTDQPGRTITRVEPSVGLALGEREASHPRLSPNGVSLWSGYINIVRPGKYTFSAAVRGGRLTVKVGEKQVLTVVADDGEAKPAKGEEFALEGGLQAFEVQFNRSGTRALVELHWQGPGFMSEPIPYMFFGHLPKQRPATFAADSMLENGRVRFEELACIRCHKPAADDSMAKGLVERSGPNLTDIGKRAYAGWLDAWLANPALLRPNTTMPKMFADTDAGRAERFAIVSYLVAIGNGKPLDRVKPPALSNDFKQSMERGRVLFTVTGCAACHQKADAKKPARNDDEDEKPPLKPEDYAYGAGSPAGVAAKYQLGALGSKSRPEQVAAYLQNPLKLNPNGRMPHMNLEPREALDLGRYLCRVTDESIKPEMPDAEELKPSLIAESVFVGADADDLERFDRLKPEAQWLELGQKLLVAKGCVNCHAVEPGGKALAVAAKYPSLAEVRGQKAEVRGQKSEVRGQKAGCLSSKPEAGKQPVYNFDGRDAAALAAFLKDGLAGAGSPAPAHAARLALKRFNCLNCHTRDGEGGIALELADAMRALAKAQNADDIQPPLLTGIGHKARTSWLKAVLTQGGKARPWLQLRMPQYGEANVRFLPTALVALEGCQPDDTQRKIALTASKVEAGKKIIGKSGLGCISCHDISGIPNSGTRGPDLATINQRVRYDWYDRWLHQPLRMAPGTKMPQAFLDDKSVLTTVLDGNADAQAEAMWAYLALGPGLPLPEGLEPPKGVVIAVKDRVEILRTFMPEAGSRAIAVGYPGSISIAFSADQCRLAYGWQGNFLDASPVWNDRGGSPAKLLGPKFWTAPPGHPWGLTSNPRIPPDFAARAKNPAFGLPLPQEPPRVYDGPMAIGFDGYSLDPLGRPTFRYHLMEGKDAIMPIAETASPIHPSIVAALQRKFAAEVPAGYQAWFLAGASAKDPRLIATTGQPMNLDLKASEVTAAASGTRVVLPLDGDKAVVLELADGPANLQWRFVAQPGGGWQTIVNLPRSTKANKISFTLLMWALPKDDEAFLKGLSAK